MLPQRVYEIIRWTIAIALPAIGLLITTLANIWNWDIPAEQISATLDAIGLCLGMIFGVNKVLNDKKAK